MTELEVKLADQARLACDVNGSGPPLLFISGLGGTSAFWQRISVNLEPDFRVIRFDQRGVGRSTRGTAACTIEQLAKDCVAVLDALNVKAAIVVGHSTGGAIAQTMCLDDPDRVIGAVLSGTWGRPERYIQALFRSRLALLHASPREYAATSVLLSYPADWINEHWSVFEAAVAGAPVEPAAQLIVAERIEALLRFNRENDVPRLSQPTLVVGARDDIIIPLFAQVHLAKCLPKPEVEVLPTGGHFFPISRAESYARVLSRWVSSRRG